MVVEPVNSNEKNLIKIIRIHQIFLSHWVIVFYFQIQKLSYRFQWKNTEFRFSIVIFPNFVRKLLFLTIFH